MVEGEEAVAQAWRMVHTALTVLVEVQMIYDWWRPSWYGAVVPGDETGQERVF